MFPPNNHLGLAELLAAMGNVPARRVTHIRMSAGLGVFSTPSFEHIELLAGSGWVKSRAEVTGDLDRGWRYYTDESAAPRAYLEIVQLGLGRYVRTKPDCTPSNNLLNLPRF